MISVTDRISVVLKAVFTTRWLLTTRVSRCRCWTGSGPEYSSQDWLSGHPHSPQEWISCFGQGSDLASIHWHSLSGWDCSGNSQPRVLTPQHTGRWTVVYGVVVESWCLVRCPLWNLHLHYVHYGATVALWTHGWLRGPCVAGACWPETLARPCMEECPCLTWGRTPRSWRCWCWPGWGWATPSGRCSWMRGRQCWKTLLGRRWSIGCVWVEILGRGFHRLLSSEGHSHWVWWSGGGWALIGWRSGGMSGCH